MVNQTAFSEDELDDVYSGEIEDLYCPFEHAPVSLKESLAEEFKFMYPNYNKIDFTFIQIFTN